MVNFEEEIGIEFLHEDAPTPFMEAAIDDAQAAVPRTKQEGLGLGLILSNATLEQLRGDLSMERLPEGGMATRIRIPLDSLRFREASD